MVDHPEQGRDHETFVRQGQLPGRVHALDDVLEQALELLATGADVAPLVAVLDDMSFLLEDEHVVAVLGHVCEGSR
jgi:hypothetical protein